MLTEYTFASGFLFEEDGEMFIEYLNANLERINKNTYRYPLKIVWGNCFFGPVS